MHLSDTVNTRPLRCPHTRPETLAKTNAYRVSENEMVWSREVEPRCILPVLSLSPYYLSCEAYVSRRTHTSGQWVSAGTRQKLQVDGYDNAEPIFVYNQPRQPTEISLAKTGRPSLTTATRCRMKAKWGLYLLIRPSPAH